MTKESGYTSSNQKALNYTSLNYGSTYRCPACASGDLNAIALMDVFACDFCRHMFTANLDLQSVQLADTVRSRIWHWNGWRWRTEQQRDTAAILVWAFSTGLTIVPVALIALSNYIFPPLEASGFPLMWIELTLIAHGAMSGWLLAEYHHWPWYISSQIRLKRLRERWLPGQG